MTPKKDPEEKGELSEKDIEAVSGGLAFTPKEIEERIRASLQGHRPSGNSVPYQRPAPEKPLDPGAL